MRRLVAVALLVAAGACGHSVRPAVWHPVAEDDYPACWVQASNQELVCGPLWAKVPADVEVAK